VSSCGSSAEIARIANDSPKFLGGFLTFYQVPSRAPPCEATSPLPLRAALAPGSPTCAQRRRAARAQASLRGLVSYQPRTLRVRVDGGEWEALERVNALAVCNGRYFGAGMMVAPQASVSDGLLDVTVWQGCAPAPAPPPWAHAPTHPCGRSFARETASVLARGRAPRRRPARRARARTDAPRACRGRFSVLDFIALTGKARPPRPAPPRPAPPRPAPPRPAPPRCGCRRAQGPAAGRGGVVSATGGRGSSTQGSTCTSRARARCAARRSRSRRRDRAKALPS